MSLDCPPREQARVRGNYLGEAPCRTYSVHPFIRIGFSLSLTDSQIQNTKSGHERFLSYPFQLLGVINSELKDVETPRRPVPNKRP